MNRKHMLKAIIRNFANHKGSFAAASFLLLMSSLFSVSTPYFIMKLLDTSIPSGNGSSLFIYIALALSAAILYNLTKLLSDYVFSKLARSFVVEIRSRCMQQLQKMHGEYYTNLSSGDVLKTLFEDIENIQQTATYSFVNFASDILVSIGMLIFLGWLQPELLMWLIVLQLIIFFVQQKFNRWIEAQTRDLRTASGELYSLIQEAASNLMNFVVIGAKSLFNNKYASLEKQNAYQQIKTQLIYSYSGSFLQLSGMFITLFILGYGGYKVIGGTLTIGGLITFNVYSQRLISPIMRASQFQTRLSGALISWKKINEILESPSHWGEKDANLQSIDSIHEIHIQDVSFQYEDKTVLSDVSLQLESPRVYAFVGESGSGKSTLTYLLLKLWTNMNGEIRINGTALNQISTDALRDQMAVVSQNTFLLNDTIYNNLALGNTSVTDNDVAEVLRIVELYDDVMALPKQLETFIGEQGIRLSGGQRQRLSIARALLRQTSVLILDEATSMLDPVTEEKLIQNLRNLIQDKIVILIAHRLRTVINAHEIFLLHNGSLVERGDHHSLIAVQSKYRAMFERTA
ncbi:hypothetical protein DNH61_21145 [Paenibacillus sambharensis]|uniref:ABC transporter ATP-binding protein n=1 Tax=Paenibacillus sambharensis TaxID=1803190 RepID=A0A2W1LHM3_9BACL|nr:ABC transporter ATP-binding protein [Paenibacillus sambharensis]PZD93994.1 hypothetical protein DNH61_21145 [Paenibacillus sambharensis]